MTPTPLQARRALIVIDVQNEYESGGLRIQYPPIAESLRNIGRAMDAAHAAGIPIIVAQQSAPATAPLFATGSPGWQLRPVVSARPHGRARMAMHRVRMPFLRLMAKTTSAKKA